MTTTDADETILNPEEIAFLLRPAPTGRLTDLAAARIVAAPEIKSKLRHIARQYAAALKKMLCSPVDAVFSASPQSVVFQSSDILFTPGDNAEIIYRLLNDDAAVLAGAVLGTPENCTRFSIGGISYNLLYRCILPLNRIIGDQFPHLFTQTDSLSPVLPAVAANNRHQGFSVLLQLDIRGHAVKLNLIFGDNVLQKQPYFKPVPANGPHQINASFINGIQRADVCLTARTVPLQLPLSQVAQWQKGTFVPLEMKPDSPIRLSAAGTPEFEAVIGRKGTRIAVKLNNKGNDK